MSPFFVSCLWCVLQVSLLCAAGVVLSLLIVRRYASSSASAVSAAAGVILIATLLVPIQIPHWSLPQVEEVETIAMPLVLSESEVSIGDTSQSSTRQNRLNIALVDFRALLSAARIAPDGTLGQPPSFAVWCTTILIALGILLGLLRLCVAFFAVWKIRHGSVPIDGESIGCEFKALARTMKCRMPVRLATSTEVQSAGVIGWLRPLVVLPADWPTWPVEQQQAVLAHELAHVVRRDYLWRSVATIARALHYYHPLAHWLLKRLAYSQEVAADQLAVQTLGSRQKYLKALSQLAIRQDDLLRFRPEPILLPTSSNFLIRRMKMLRTKERTQSRGMNRVVRMVAVSTVLLLAVVTTALRGLAEPTGDPPTTPSAQTEGEQNSTGALFQYSPLDPAIIGENEDGIFVLRVAELLKRDLIKPKISAANQMVSTVCQTFFSSPELPAIDLRIIDYVAGQAEFKVKRLERTPASQHNSQVMLGSNCWVVRFRCDISSWQEWIKKYVPAAEELQHGEITYFQLPAIPAFGLTGFCVAARDNRTLVFSIDGEPIWDRLEASNTASPDWSDAWNAIDGGLFTIGI